MQGVLKTRGPSASHSKTTPVESWLGTTAIPQALADFELTSLQQWHNWRKLWNAVITDLAAINPRHKSFFFKPTKQKQLQRQQRAETNRLRSCVALCVPLTREKTPRATELNRFFTLWGVASRNKVQFAGSDAGGQASRPLDPGTIFLDDCCVFVDVEEMRECRLEWSL